MFANRIRHLLPESPVTSPGLPAGFTPLPAAATPVNPSALLQQLYQQAYQQAQRDVQDRLLNLLRSRAGFAQGGDGLN